MGKSSLFKGLLIGFVMVVVIFAFGNTNKGKNNENTYKITSITTEFNNKKLAKGSNEIVKSKEEVNDYLTKELAITTAVEEINKKGKANEISPSKWKESLDILISHYKTLNYPNEESKNSVYNFILSLEAIGETVPKKDKQLFNEAWQLYVQSHKEITNSMSDILYPVGGNLKYEIDVNKMDTLKNQLMKDILK